MADFQNDKYISLFITKRATNNNNFAHNKTYIDLIDIFDHGD